MTEAWERLQKVIDSTGLSVNAFALSIGLPRGENLYQIKRGNNGISVDLAQRIHANYPQYSVAWLLLGIPESFIADDLGKIVRLPFYKDIQSTEFPSPQAPDDHLVLSESLAQHADFAVPYADDILNPYLHDAILLLKKQKAQDIILFGNIYLIETPEFRLFRIVKNDYQNPTSVHLSSLRSDYGDIIIPKDRITGLWLVVGAISGLFY